MEQLVGASIAIHGIWRWVLIVVGLIAVVRFGYGWLAKKPFTENDRKLALGYAIVVTIQFVLGLINVVGLLLIGGFNPAKDIEHVIYGLIATAVAHLPPRWKNAVDTVRFRNTFICVLLSLLIGLFSVWRLRGSFLFGLG